MIHSLSVWARVDARDITRKAKRSKPTMGARSPRARALSPFFFAALDGFAFLVMSRAVMHGTPSIVSPRP